MAIPEIRFTYNSIDPKKEVSVFFTYDDSNIDNSTLIMKDKNATLLEIEELSMKDLTNIFTEIEDWVIHYKIKELGFDQ